jgi:hypothetical protein
MLCPILSENVPNCLVLSDFLQVGKYIFDRNKIYTILNINYYEKRIKNKQVAAMDSSRSVWANAYAKCNGGVGV